MPVPHLRARPALLEGGRLNVVDYPSTVTEEQLSRLREAASKARALHVDVRVHCGRAAIFHGPTDEPVQFITTSNVHVVTWMIAGWERHFESLREKALRT